MRFDQEIFDGALFEAATATVTLSQGKTGGRPRGARAMVLKRRGSRSIQAEQSINKRAMRLPWNR